MVILFFCETRGTTLSVHLMMVNSPVFVLHLLLIGATASRPAFEHKSLASHGVGEHGATAVKGSKYFAVFLPQDQGAKMCEDLGYNQDQNNCDHVTIKFKPTPAQIEHLYSKFAGTSQDVDVLMVADIDTNAAALVHLHTHGEATSPLPSTNDWPHVTLKYAARETGRGPVWSSCLLIQTAAMHDVQIESSADGYPTKAEVGANAGTIQAQLPPVLEGSCGSMKPAEGESVKVQALPSVLTYTGVYCMNDKW